MIAATTQIADDPIPMIRGLRPRMTLADSPAASSAAGSSVNSVTGLDTYGSFASRVPIGSAVAGAPDRHLTPRRLLLADRREVELVVHVVHVAAQVHARVE